MTSLAFGSPPSLIGNATFCGGILLAASFPGDFTFATSLRSCEMCSGKVSDRRGGVGSGVGGSLSGKQVNDAFVGLGFSSGLWRVFSFVKYGFVFPPSAVLAF